jgi:anaerobic magnesium-protoporphyrin IX monomethyl ester cyclase
MDKVILIYPRIEGSGNAALPPLSLISIATFLLGRYDVRIIDQGVDAEWRRTLERELSAGSCVCTGISTMTGPQIGTALEAGALVRSLAPELPIVWGGVHPSLLPEETLHHDLVDIVVVGDGEETFAELVETLRDGGDLRNVRGIVFKEGARQVRTAPRPAFALQKIPDAAFSLVHLDRYHPLTTITKKRYLPIITSRGCPFHCGFCYNARFHGRRWSSLSAEQTVSWISGLRARFGITDLILLDDNFFVDLRRVAAICHLLAQESATFGIHNANCRADTLLKMDDGLLALLRNTGFKRLFVGVESGSDKVLELIKKGTTVDDVLRANQRLRRAGIDPCYGFMAGFPGETLAEVKQTLHLMNQLIEENSAATVYPLQFYTPFPGTDLAEESKARGLPFPSSLAEWSGYHYDRLHFPVQNKAHARFLRDMHFYSRYLDDKFMAAHGFWKRQLLRLYSRMLRARIRSAWYRCLVELRLLRSWRKAGEGSHAVRALAERAVKLHSWRRRGRCCASTCD